jgi:hypothetical protein
MSPDVAASIKARLLNRAKERGEQFELFLVRYACERFLYRLGASECRDKCILKGAGLLTLWMDDPYRATRDLDFLAIGSNDEASIRSVIETVCAVACPEDGLTFDLDSLDLSPIRAEDEYQGQRVVMRAYLGKAKIRLQVDFGFGDAVTPGPEDAVYPRLLDTLPAPRLRTYPRVVTVAEKFEAMIQLGRRDSRMKDFHDIWALSNTFSVDGPLLRGAIVACFERRGTAWTPAGPDVLASAFYGDANLQALWGDYARGGAFRTPPPAAFESIGERVREFLGPVRDSIVAGDSLDMHWSAAGPWQ